MEKGTSQFLRSAGRCGAMRRGVHAGMPLGTLPCPTPASLGENNLLFQKTLIFWETSQGQGMQQPRPRQPPMGMQQPRRPRHAAAKA